MGTSCPGGGSSSVRNVIRPPIVPGISAIGPRSKAMTSPKTRPAKARQASSVAALLRVAGMLKVKGVHTVIRVAKGAVADDIVVATVVMTDRIKALGSKEGSQVTCRTKT